MLHISGHLRTERCVMGYGDSVHSVVVNCCGWDYYKKRDQIHQRPEGRLDYQLIYLCKGTGRFLLDNQWLSLSAGNIVLYRPGQPQFYSYYASEKAEVYWIHFTGTDCGNLMQKYEICDSYIGENSSLVNLFKDVITELQLKKKYYEDVVVNNFVKMLILICRSRRQRLMPSENNYTIDRLILQLNQSYMEKWTVSSMADYCRLSSGYFSDSFKNYTGKSPIHFLNDIRIEKAKDLLSANTLTISAVAALVGFSDPLYFSRVFKKSSGIAPQNFSRNTMTSNTPEWH